MWAAGTGGDQSDVGHWEGQIAEAAHSHTRGSHSHKVHPKDPGDTASNRLLLIALWEMDEVQEFCQKSQQGERLLQERARTSRGRLWGGGWEVGRTEMRGGQSSSRGLAGQGMGSGLFLR